MTASVLKIRSKHIKHSEEQCCSSAVLWPEEGDFPQNLRRAVYVIINKRSFESVMCLDHLRKNKHCHKSTPTLSLFSPVKLHIYVNSVQTLV